MIKVTIESFEQIAVSKCIDIESTVISSIYSNTEVIPLFGYERKQQSDGKITLIFEGLPDVGIDWQEHFEEKFPETEGYEVVIIKE